MKCRLCSQEARTQAEADMGLGLVVRRYECPCGATWVTDEKERRGTFDPPKKRDLTPFDPQGKLNLTPPKSDLTPFDPPQISTPLGNLTPLKSSQKGSNLTIDPKLTPFDQERSDLGSSLQTGSDPGSPVADPSEKLRKRGKSAAYPPAFERCWEATSKTGSKADAFEAWKRVGAPAPEVVAASWAKWMALRSWQDGFIPHVRKWFRGRYFEQEPLEPQRTNNVHSIRQPRRPYA